MIKYFFSRNEITFLNSFLPYDVYYYIYFKNEIDFHILHLFEHTCIRKMKNLFNEFIEIEGMTNNEYTIIKLLILTSNVDTKKNILYSFNNLEIDENLINKELKIIHSEYKSVLKRDFIIEYPINQLLASFHDLKKNERKIIFNNALTSNENFKEYNDNFYKLCIINNNLNTLILSKNNRTRFYYQDIVIKEKLNVLKKYGITYKCRNDSSFKQYIIADEFINMYKNTKVIGDNFVNLFCIDDYDKIDYFVKEILSYNLSLSILMLEQI